MKPTLLLLAGMLNDARIWAPVASRLDDAADVRVVHFPDQDSMAAMAAHAWQAVDDVPAGQDLAIAGFSMGGYVLQAMLAQPRRKVEALALIDSAIRPETPESASKRLKTLEAIEGDFAALTEQVARWGTHPSRHGDEAFMQPIRDMLREVGAATAARQTRAIAHRSDLSELMRRQQVPLLIVCGRQDKVTPPALSQEAADALPGADLHWLEDTGHMTPLERSDELAQIMRRWLARINAAR
jgi:pimeloyl-ACP methyl ester carboxylesterase